MQIHREITAWIKLRQSLVLMLFGFMLAACSQNSDPQKGVISDDQLSAPLPSVIAALALDKTNLIVDVAVDGGKLLRVEDLVVDTVNKTFSGKIPSIGEGSYTLSLIFSVIDPTYGRVELATTSGIKVDVVANQETPADFSSATLILTDTDGDDISNLDELDEGSNPTESSYYVGGTVSGLLGSGAVIQLNGGNDLILSGDDSFTFVPAVADASSYSVTVLTQPGAPGQTCTVTNGSGTVSGANITDVTVTCVVNDAVLDSISLNADTIDVALGNSASMYATGHYSDGSSVDITAQVTWSIADDTIASINSFGQITTLAQGSTFVNAQLDAKFASSTLNVSAPVLVMLSMTPQSQSIPLGSTYTVRVDGTYSDDSTAAVTDQVSWSTSSPNISVSASGIVSASAEGVYTLTASLDGNAVDAQVTITPKEIVSISLSPGNPGVSLGERVSFTATATYTDGSQADVTNVVDWASSATNIAIVDNNSGSKGLTKNIIAGVATISATHIDSGVSGNTQYTALGDKVVNRAYLLSMAGDLVVVDTIDDTILTTVALDGTGVGGITLYPAQPLYAFIAHYATDSVSRLDLTTHTVTHSIPVGNGPGTVLSYTDSFNNTPDKIYVVNINSGFGNGTLSIIDPSTNAVTNTLTLGEFPSDAAVKINSQGRVFIVNEASPVNGRPGSVMSLDTATDTLTTLTGVGECPREVAYRRRTDRMIVGNDCSTGASTTYSAQFVEISSVSGAVAQDPVSLPANGSISALAVNSEGLHTYVWHRSGLINIFEYVFDTIVDTISRPSWALAIEYNYYQNKLYIGTNCTQSPAAVDVYDENYNLLNTITMPGCIGYHGMAFTP